MYAEVLKHAAFAHPPPPPIMLTYKLRGAGGGGKKEISGGVPDPFHESASVHISYIKYHDHWCKYLKIHWRHTPV